MRIISGRFKGRNIRMPRGIRPTQDKVRKALFDILRDIKDLSFLDLYAGSGAIGLEALSQGVSRVVFVEINRRCVEKIKESLAAVGLTRERVSALARYQVIEMDVNKAIEKLEKRGEKFDIVFLDPPYYQDLAKKTLKMLNRYDIVSASGMIICQHFKKDILPEVIDGLRLARQAEYGDTVLSFYKRDS